MSMLKSRAEQLGENTLFTKLGLWAGNLRDNLPEINKNKDITDLKKIEGAVLCLASGDSLNLHFDEIKLFKGTILACERNLIPLLENSIIPDYVVSIDGSDIMTKFINHPIVDKYSDKIVGVFATTVSPKFINRWKGKKVFFNAWLDNVDEIKSVSLVFQEITKKSICHTGGHCGSTLWFLSYFLKANPIILLGIDMAYPTSIPDLSHTSIWEGIKNLSKEEILKYYRREVNPFGNEVITDYVWEGFKDSWMSWIKEMQDSKTIQCSDYTILHDEPIIIKKFEEYLEVNHD